MPCLALKLFDFSQLLIRKNSHNCICLNCYETGKHNFQLSRNNSIMGRTLRYLFRGEGAQPHWVQKALETKNFTDPWRLTPPHCVRLLSIHPQEAISPNLRITRTFTLQASRREDWSQLKLVPRDSVLKISIEHRNNRIRIFTFFLPVVTLVCNLNARHYQISL